MELAQVKNTFGRWLYLEDDEFIDLVLATVVAHRFQGDPVWLFLIAPPGAGKTELLRSLKTENVVHLSNLTSHTLVSGLNLPRKKDPSILPLLDGKVVVIKDFTAILSEHQKLRSQIFGQLRDIYDGQAAKAFGSGVGIRSHNCRMGLIAGVTPAVEKYQSIDQVLGERFLNYRIRYDRPERAVDKALENAGRTDDMRGELSRVVGQFLERDWTATPEAINMTRMHPEMLRSLASAIALLRTAVPKNKTGTMDFLPEAELATRLVIQLKKTGAALSIVRGKSDFTDEEYGVLLKVARDSVPSLRMHLIQGMVEACRGRRHYVSTGELAEVTSLATTSVKATLEDLVTLRIVERTESKPVRWRLKERLLDHLKNSEFLLLKNKLELSTVPFPGGVREGKYGDG
jgi:hypothetical protein